MMKSKAFDIVENLGSDYSGTQKNSEPVINEEGESYTSEIFSGSDAIVSNNTNSNVAGDTIEASNKETLEPYKNNESRI